MMACSVEGCDRDVRAKGLCGAHHEQMRRTGRTWMPIGVWRAPGSAPDHGVTAYSKGCRCVECVAAKMEQRKVWQVRKQAEGLPERVHGTRNGYVNYRCRCDECKRAWTEYCRELREARTIRGVPAGMHGSYNAYLNYGCRCIQCREAKRAHSRQARARKVAS